MTALSGSYAPEDVTFLLTPVALATVEVDAKERLIQSGRRHYSEMLAPERSPDAAYLALYRETLARNGPRLAGDIAGLARALAARRPGRPVVLASLARAGTPIGVLLRRALIRLGVDTHHYALSIIRDRGVDRRALAYIAARHDPADAVFIDGWTGKGTIARELRAALPPGQTFQPLLAVVADPAGVADLAATADDYLIPSGMLNGVVSGLVSRSVLNAEVEAAGGFHGCVLLDALALHDVSRAFVETVDGFAAPAPAPASTWCAERRPALARRAAESIAAIGRLAGVADVNRIKPGLAEAARAILRRTPGRLFLADADDADLAPLRHLAATRGVAVEPLPPGPYRAVAVIRSVGHD